MKGFTSKPQPSGSGRSAYPDIISIATPGRARGKSLAQFHAAHLRHHDIRQQQVNRSAMPLCGGAAPPGRCPPPAPRSRSTAKHSIRTCGRRPRPRPGESSRCPVPPAAHPPPPPSRRGRRHLRRAAKSGNAAPRPGSLVTDTTPPLCCTIPYTIDNPRPVPLPFSLVVKNGSKMRSRTSVRHPHSVVGHCQFDIRARRNAVGFSRLDIGGRDRQVAAVAASRRAHSPPDS